jgi:hypothetical protein
VLGVAFANRCGVLANIASRTLMNVAGNVLVGQTVGPGGVPKDDIRRADGGSTKLPTAFLLAVTAGEVHVFEIRMVMGRVKLKGTLGVFQRSGLELAVDENQMTTVFYIRSQGQDMTFEIMGGEMAGADYARQTAALLRG